MRHEAIEMVCAHVGQGREPPPHHSGVLEVSALTLGILKLIHSDQAKNILILFESL